MSFDALGKAVLAWAWLCGIALVVGLAFMLAGCSDLDGAAPACVWGPVQ